MLSLLTCIHSIKKTWYHLILWKRTDWRVLGGNCGFSPNSHTRKLGEVSIFFAMVVTTLEIFWEMLIHKKVILVWIGRIEWTTSFRYPIGASLCHSFISNLFLVHLFNVLRNPAVGYIMKVVNRRRNNSEKESCFGN